MLFPEWMLVINGNKEGKMTLEEDRGAEERKWVLVCHQLRVLDQTDADGLHISKFASHPI